MIYDITGMNCHAVESGESNVAFRLDCLAVSVPGN